MNKSIFTPLLVGLLALSAALSTFNLDASGAAEQTQAAEPEKGPNNGRLLKDQDFVVELAIFETGVPPEFRVWASQGGQAIAPEAVNISIELMRLGNVIDSIQFRAEGDYLRGDMEVYEPHSFVVTLKAEYLGKQYQWQYDNLEGRTQITDAIADSMGIKTEIAGEQTLHQSLNTFGSLVLPEWARRHIQARFDGEIKALHVVRGDTVSQGQLLLTIESNESLKSFPVKAPIAGVISQQFANTGEQTNGRTLVEITDASHLLAELAVYPSSVEKVKLNAPVNVRVSGIERTYSSHLTSARPQLRGDQAKLFLAPIDNKEHGLSEGAFVEAQIRTASFTVPLAVKRTALQSFRDFTVVYAKVGEEYEVRMLELGREAGEWVEVLGGLEPGTEYVTDNSFIIKADIEKSGASHDH